MALAQFVEEMMAEEKYSDEFTSRLPERLAQLNASQLAKMQEALEDAVHGAGTTLVRKANRALLVQIAPQAEVAMEQKIRKEKIELDARKKKQKKADLQAARVAGAERMRQLIRERAHQQAKQEIDDREHTRIVQQKAVMLKEMPFAEKRRVRHFVVAATLLLVLVAAVAAFFTSIEVILIGVGIACVVSALIAWRGHTLINLAPKIVPQIVLDREIEQRAVILIEEKIRELKQHEIEARAKEKAEQEEQRQIRMQRERLQAANAEHKDVV